MSIPEKGEVEVINSTSTVGNDIENKKPIYITRPKKSKKIISLVIVIIILLSTIFAIDYFGIFSETKAEVPKWKEGDTWIYNSSFQGNMSKAYDIGIFVREVTNYKNNEFFQIGGYIDPMFRDRFISAKDLNPIVLRDFNNGTFKETDRPYDFPLYNGKRWEFTTENNRTYKYDVEAAENIKVLDKTYFAYKIRKKEGNKTRRVTYYSPDVKNVVKMLNYYDEIEYFDLYQLKSFTNEPWKRLVETQILDNIYNSKLERWEEKHDPTDDWITTYKVHYSMNGESYYGYFDSTRKSHLDWIANNTEEDDKILCWWDYGHDIRGYTGRDVVVDGPSPSLWNTIANPWETQRWNKESDIMNVARALVGTPNDTREVMNQYNATLIYVKSRELVLEARNVGIFPALVQGCKRDLDDYYEIFYRTSSGKVIKKEEYQYDPNDDVIGYIIEFKDAYHDSMIYRARFGYSVEDIFPGEDKEGLPEYSGDLYFYPIIPCWNQSNFKVIYRTAWWNPFPRDEYGSHPNSWQIMEYLDVMEKLKANDGTSNLNGRSNLNSGDIIARYIEGAILQGKIVDGNGTPMVGVNITVTDEYAVPHQMVQIDALGNYSLIVPFGNLTITISQGDVDRSVMIGDPILEENITVELYQAMREEVDLDNNGSPDYLIYKDFIILD
jgi:hypothetical protein